MLSQMQLSSVLTGLAEKAHEYRKRALARTAARLAYDEAVSLERQARVTVSAALADVQAVFAEMSTFEGAAESALPIVDEALRAIMLREPEGPPL